MQVDFFLLPFHWPPDNEKSAQLLADYFVFMPMQKHHSNGAQILLVCLKPEWFRNFEITRPVFVILMFFENVFF